LDESYKLYAEFERAQGRVPVERSEMCLYRLFSAHYRGQLVSAVYVTEGRELLRIRSIFSRRLETDDQDLRKVISNASRRVMWEVCRWGMANGFIGVDLASVNFGNPS